MTTVILLTGANGQLGYELSRMLPQLGEVTSVDRQKLDLSNPEDIRKAIRAVRPNLIVNAGAFTAVDQAESNEAAARAINSVAPAVMAEEAKKIGAAVVHYSTDCVFDGTKSTPYVEEDPPNPPNVYGKTKLEGELAIQHAGVPHLIFRTAWVYATRGQNFLLTILKLATQREELRIVQDQVGAPTWSREIARGTTEILTQLLRREGSAGGFEAAIGVYHMTADGEASRYDFAKAILEEASKCEQAAPWFHAATNNLPLLTRRVIPITTKEHPAPARRPAYSVLSNARLAKTFQIQLPDWRSQLRATFADRKVIPSDTLGGAATANPKPNG
jgi:dTDP-4-dehydrorhamnose reductase